MINSEDCEALRRELLDRVRLAVDLRVELEVLTMPERGVAVWWSLEREHDSFTGKIEIASQTANECADALHTPSPLTMSRARAIEHIRNRDALLNVVDFLTRTIRGATLTAEKVRRDVIASYGFTHTVKL